MIDTSALDKAVATMKKYDGGLERINEAMNAGSSQLDT